MLELFLDLVFVFDLVLVRKVGEWKDREGLGCLILFVVDWVKRVKKWNRWWFVRKKESCMRG